MAGNPSCLGTQKGGEVRPRKMIVQIIDLSYLVKSFLAKLLTTEL